MIMYVGSNYAPGGYLWIFPKGDRSANIGIGISGKYSRNNISKSNPSFSSSASTKKQIRYDDCLKSRYQPYEAYSSNTKTIKKPIMCNQYECNVDAAIDMKKGRIRRAHHLQLCCFRVILA